MLTQALRFGAPVFAAVVAASVSLPLTAQAATAAPAANPLSFTQGFTVVTTGDARLGNAELEGSIAVAGNVSFAKGYPIIHSSGLTPTNYAIPVVTGHPTRVLVGGQFLPLVSSGVTEVSSRGHVRADQLGYVQLGDTANLSLNPRSTAGVWLSTVGTTAGTDPAMYVPDVVAQPSATVEAPGAYAATLGGASAAGVAAATQLSGLASCATSALTALAPGSHGGARTLAIQPDVTNYLSVTAADLGSFEISLTGASLDATTTLVVNVTGDVSAVTLPRFAAASSTNASQPNDLAPYVLWNFGAASGPVAISGDKITGSILAPAAAVHLNTSSPLEGQLVSKDLETTGGEIHHYAFAGLIGCPTTTGPGTTGPGTTNPGTTGPGTTGPGTTNPGTTDPGTTTPGTTSPGTSDPVTTPAPGTVAAAGSAAGTVAEGSHLASTGRDFPWIAASIGALAALLGAAVLLVTRSRQPRQQG